MSFTQDLFVSINRSSHQRDVDLFTPLKSLCQYKPGLSCELWPKLFAPIWNQITAADRFTFVKMLVTLLSKEYHYKQSLKTPNVIQVLMDGLLECEPFDFPPHLISHLGMTFNCWHSSIRLLERLAENLVPKDPSTAESESRFDENVHKALCDLYARLEESDYCYGLWRRQSLFVETNMALSFQQIGSWQQAQNMYEIVQNKARSGALPFSQAEYEIWEMEWIHCTKKLQQWDLLLDISKGDADATLLLDSAWRVSDWITEKDSIDVAMKSAYDPDSTKLKFYESYLCLLQFSPEKMDKQAEFSKMCDGAIQSALKAWRSLPICVSVSHIPLLSTFQKLVELSDAAQIQTNLIGTTAANIDSKSTELKTILMTWRERLPNLHDDISIWDDIVTWRQHIFGLINKAYVPLIPVLQQTQNQGPTNSYGYRGFHETGTDYNNSLISSLDHQSVCPCCPETPSNRSVHKCTEQNLHSTQH